MSKTSQESTLNVKAEPVQSSTKTKPPIYRPNPGVIVEGPYAPEYATDGAAGFDLRAWVGAPWEINPGETLKIPTGLKFKIPHGYEIQIRPRSGLASQGIVAQFGTVDSDYRGEVSVILHNQSDTPHLVQHGDRIAQGVLAPVTRAYFVEGSVADDTERGSGGFGSTGGD